MKDLVRDSFIGQQINHFSGGRLLSYTDQRPNYTIPQRYLSSGQSSDTKVRVISILLSPNRVLTDRKGIIGHSYTDPGQRVDKNACSRVGRHEHDTKETRRRTV